MSDEVIYPTGHPQASTAKVTLGDYKKLMMEHDIPAETVALIIWSASFGCVNYEKLLEYLKKEGE